MKTSMTRLVVVALVMTVMAATSFAAEVNFRYFPTGGCLPPAPWNQCAPSDKAGIVIYLTYDKSLSPDSFNVAMTYSILNSDKTVSSINTAQITVPGLEGSGTIMLLPYTNRDIPNVVIDSITATMNVGIVSVTTLVREPVPGPTY